MYHDFFSPSDLLEQHPLCVQDLMIYKLSTASNQTDMPLG